MPAIGINSKYIRYLLLPLCLIASFIYLGEDRQFTIVKSLSAADQTQKYICPMHPHYISNDKGSCPICGMDLIAKADDKTRKADALSSAPKPITIAPETIQNMGVRHAKVENALFGRTILSYGIVEENERLRSEISSRVEGWVEKLSVTAIGDTVKTGDTLFSIYSPELIVSQRDYLSSLTANNTTLIRSVEQRLSSFGVQSTALKLIKKNRKIFHNVPFFAERDGTISEINIRRGTYVKRGMSIAKIQDYSKVWLVVSVAEKDLSFISKDTNTRIIFPNTGQKEVLSKVDYVYPTIDKFSRTGQVRLVVDNAGGKIRPGAYADVIFEVASQQRLSVPTEAILRKATGSFVIVALKGGRFQPRAVKTGLVSDRQTEIIEGLDVGEDIVVSGQFLLDSESALAESFRKFDSPNRPLALLNLSETEIAIFDHLIDAALYIHETTLKAEIPEPKFLKPATEIKQNLWPAYGTTTLGSILTNADNAVRQAIKARTKTAVVRSLNALVSALKPFILEGAPLYYQAKKITLYKEANTGNLWLQLTGKPQNPYSSETATALPFISVPPMPVTDKASDQGASKSMRGSHGNH